MAKIYDHGKDKALKPKNQPWTSQTIVQSKYLRRYEKRHRIQLKTGTARECVFQGDE